MATVFFQDVLIMAVCVNGTALYTVVMIRAVCISDCLFVILSCGHRDMIISGRYIVLYLATEKSRHGHIYEKHNIYKHL